MNGTFPRRSFHRKQAKMKGLLQNSPNEKNEIDFPERGLSISFYFIVRLTGCGSPGGISGRCTGDGRSSSCRIRLAQPDPDALYYS